MLISDSDGVVNWGRIYLIESTGGFPTLMPHAIPEHKLDEFCKGYADMLHARVGQENRRATFGKEYAG